MDEMTKLIAAFTANPSREAAVKLVRYLDKHMMAECLATPEQADAIGAARKAAA